MRSKADETLVIVETLICPLLISDRFYVTTVFDFKSFINFQRINESLKKNSSEPRSRITALETHIILLLCLHCLKNIS